MKIKKGKFKCNVCYENHNLFDVVEFDLPRHDSIPNLLSGEVDFESNERWFIIDNRIFFVKGIIKIPYSENDNFFSWIVWIVVDRKDFFNFINILSPASEATHFIGEGKLFAKLPIEESFGLELNYTQKTTEEFPEITLKNSNHKLSQICQNGIPQEEVNNILSSIYHPETYREDIPYNKKK